MKATVTDWRHVEQLRQTVPTRPAEAHVAHNSQGTELMVLVTVGEQVLELTIAVDDELLSRFSACRNARAKL